MKRNVESDLEIM